MLRKETTLLFVYLILEGKEDNYSKQNLENRWANVFMGNKILFLKINQIYV